MTNSTRRSHALALAAIYVTATVIGMFLASLTYDSAFSDGQYIPAGNDSFYHAHRILDAIETDAGFYEFDTRLHVPEGTWIPWPWAYDYLLAQAAKFVLWLNPTTNPLAFLAWVPVAWVAVNAALFLLAAGQLGLSIGFRALLMLAFALSPLTQMPHSVAMLDHHYIEHTFVLLNIWLGLRWFSDITMHRSAAALGLALGVATAFHNGLFILQLPVLATAFLLWCRGTHLPLRSVAWLAGAMVLATLVMLLPSQPFQEFKFEFALHSWFHLYAAACSASVLLFMAWRPFTVSRLAGLAALSAVLAIPIAAEIIRGAAFLGTKFSVLDEIVEAKSVFQLFVDSLGPMQTLGFYSWLLLVAPLLIAFFCWQIVVQKTPQKLFFAVISVFGLALLLTQFRFHYHGLFVLLAGTFYLLQSLSERMQWNRKAFLAVSLALLAIAYQPPLRERLFTVYPLGADFSYAAIRPLFFRLGDLCSNDPGVVLANHGDGNYILFHSNCSVIANNFIMRDADETKINEIDRLFRLPIDDIRRDPVGVRYILIRARDFSNIVDGASEIVAASSIARHLLLDEEPPAGYERIDTIYSESNDGKIIARLYKVHN